MQDESCVVERLTGKSSNGIAWCAIVHDLGRNCVRASVNDDAVVDNGAGS